MRFQSKTRGGIPSRRSSRTSRKPTLVFAAPVRPNTATCWINSSSRRPKGCRGMGAVQDGPQGELPGSQLGRRGFEVQLPLLEGQAEQPLGPEADVGLQDPAGGRVRHQQPPPEATHVVSA